VSSQLQCVPGTTSVIGVLDAFGFPVVGFDVGPGARVVRTALGEGEGEGGDGDGAGGGAVVSLGSALGVALAGGAAEAACGAGSGCGPESGAAAHTTAPTVAAATAATIPARRPLPCHAFTVPASRSHRSSVCGA